ncbi:MAG TPA: BadF/BadG/BcrA/BcrD ATPase family protein [Solirubrobacteraceae bacterium]|nr:BadF/BadG/BcrA/BcrD ATPase family protein [Solirubrobacteraceae bacterium]
MNGEALVLAVDGGGVKTDLALLRGNGRVLAVVRGGGSSPHHIGVEGSVALLERLRAEALRRAGLDAAAVAAAAQILMAGADLPEERDTLEAAIRRMNWSQSLGVENDTLALLRSGTDRGWGVAVVCGAGLNCIGVAPDGRRARFLALGAITGDWGGGGEIGMAALGAAVRSADRRGPKTVLEDVVPAHFQMAEPLDVSRALHLRELSTTQLGELAPAVFSACADDQVAAAIVARLADEIVAWAVAAILRLELGDGDPDVVLGGGVLRALPSAAIERIADGVTEAAPAARVTLAPSSPIVGAALLALDELGADAETAARARAELDRALGAIEASPPQPDGHELVRSSRG